MCSSYSERASSVNRDRESTAAVKGTQSYLEWDTPELASTLVNNPISQRPPHHPRSKAFFDSFNEFICFRRDIKICRLKQDKKSSASTKSNKKSIHRFSESSKRRLKQVASNCFPEIRSQFLLTFHDKTPTDGKLVKKLLNSFLTRIRNKDPTIKYIWVMEFTRKGNPHVHVYLTCTNSSQFHQYLAKTWNRICDESEQHLKVHLHQKNFVSWDMGSGAYVCKYLDKRYQKNVPESFDSVGRFWGSSRGLVEPQSINSAKEIRTKFEPQIDLATGEIPSKHYSIKFIYRTLRKYQESKVRFVSQKVQGKKRRYKSSITRLTDAYIPNGTIIFHQIMEFLQCQNPPIPF